MSYFSNQASKPGCAWAAHFRPAFHPSQPDGPCYLQCKHCDEYLSASNTSSILKSHKSACKPKPKPAIAPVAVAALVDAGQGKTQPVKGPMDQFVSSVSPALEQQVLDELAMFIYTSETPFQRINNKHLIKAFQLLGVKLPGETALRTTMLDRAYQRVQATAQAQLDSAAVSVVSAINRLHSSADCCCKPFALLIVRASGCQVHCTMSSCVHQHTSL